MNHFVFLFVLSSTLLIGCSDNNKTKIPKVADNIKKENEFVPIFLSLNPNMDDSQFYEKIIDEVKLGNLSNEKKFILPVKKNPIFNYDSTQTIDLDLSVLKKNIIKSIRLYGKYEYEVNWKNLNQDNAHKYIDNNKLMINEIIKYYEKKYVKIPYIFIPKKTIETMNLINGQTQIIVNEPGNSDKGFRDYGLYEKKYVFFKDSVKTIIIGYTIIGKDYDFVSLNFFDEYEYQNLRKEHLKLKEKNKKTKELSIDEFLKKDLSDDERRLLFLNHQMDLFIDQHNLSKNNYGFKITIDYIENNDFEQLQNKMKQDSVDFFNSRISEERKNEELKFIKNQKRKITINKI